MSVRFPAPAVRALIVGLCCSACQSDPKGSDAFVSHYAGWPNQGFIKGVGVYLPNRLMDVIDVVHVGVGFGPGAGVEVHPTRYLRLGAGAGIEDGVAWFGRMGQPFSGGHYARASLGPLDAQETTDQELRWRIPRWDFGVWLHVYVWEAYLGIAPDEILDFIVGISTFDLKDDDYGRDSGRETRNVHIGGVEDARPKVPEEPVAPVEPEKSDEAVEPEPPE
jgi:hypothetical protein